MMMGTSKTTAADIRAAIARSGIPAYIIGARARVNPIRLSRITRGHCRITDSLAARILLAVEKEIAAHDRKGQAR
ncbi:MAG TPA: hypothetical protein VGQ08_17030 [Nitrospiraceae bacterium]|jgi:hypothetical protein|nr:hypothetical protein [Nitrospiraceae bacterium]